MTNSLTLGVFLVVDVALCLIQWREPAGADGFRVPRVVPPLAALLSSAVLGAEVVR